MATAYALSEEDRSLIADVIRVVRSLGGVDAFRRAAKSTVQPGPFAKLATIVSSTATATVDANGNAVQYTYEIQEVAKVKEGYQDATNTGVWQSLGTDYVYDPAYNMIEDGNTGTGRQRYGVDHDGALVDGIDMAMQPLQNGTVVLFVWIPVATAAGDLTVEPWIIGTWNSIDGTCDAA